MIYSPRDNIRRKQKRTQITLVLAGILVVVLLLNFFAPQLLSPISHTIGLPLLKSRLAASAGGSELWQLLKSKQSLYGQNRTLREEAALFKAIEVERDALKNENASLRDLLGRSTSTDPVILAQILSKPGFSPYDTLILDVGETDGVKAGDLVLVENTLVVGQISTVQGHSSNALLYSSPEHKTEIFIGTKSVQAVAIGKGAGSFEVRVPRNTEFKVGDEVRLAAFPDVVFGAVTDINGASADTFDRILFRSLIDISDLRFVMVKHQP